MNLLGKLTWSAIPFDQPIIMGATAFMVLVIVTVLAFITFKGYWAPLWRLSPIARSPPIFSAAS